MGGEYEAIRVANLTITCCISRLRGAKGENERERERAKMMEGQRTFHGERVPALAVFRKRAKSPFLLSHAPTANGEQRRRQRRYLSTRSFNLHECFKPYIFRYGKVGDRAYG